MAAPSTTPVGKTENNSKTMDIINSDIQAIVDYLDKRGAGSAEWERVTGPLVAAVQKGQFRQRIRKALCITVGTILILITAKLFWKMALIQKLWSVMYRMMLIWILPYWDWTTLYYADCFITNPYYVSKTLMEDDCNVCESLVGLEQLSNTSQRVVSDEYLQNDVPFVVTDAMQDWPIMNTDDFWFDNITEMFLSDELKNAYPCELASNLRLRTDDLRAFMRKIHNTDTHRWYGHWENCDKRATKVMRKLYERPYFIPNMVDLSQSNWVLISSDFTGKVYKEIEFESELLMVAQIRGWSRIRLTPQEPCDHYCPELHQTLAEGSIVVVTSMLWRFEYIPGEQTDNLAIGVGGFWN